jgi:hypothetical protein
MTAVWLLPVVAAEVAAPAAACSRRIWPIRTRSW